MSRLWKRVVSLPSGCGQELDLATVADVAVGELRCVAQHPHRRPLREVGERQRAVDRRPARVAAQLREPGALRADEVERQEAQRAVGEAREEALRAAADHVPAADHRRDVDLLAGALPVLDGEGERAVGGLLRHHDRVRERERPAVEGRDRLHLARQAAGVAVRRRGPQVVLLGVARPAGVGTDEVAVEGRRRGARQRRRERAVAAAFGATAIGGDAIAAPRHGGARPARRPVPLTRPRGATSPAPRTGTARAGAAPAPGSARARGSRPRPASGGSARGSRRPRRCRRTACRRRASRGRPRPRAPSA